MMVDGVMFLWVLKFVFCKNNSSISKWYLTYSLAGYKIFARMHRKAD